MVTKRLQAGVTLVELLVVVGIFAVVSSVLLFNFSDFSTNVSVRNLAQDIGLSIRKAQSYATSVRSINSSGLQSDQFPAYGISFTVGNTIASNDFNADPKQFVLFADVGGEGNRLYDRGSHCANPDAGDECVESFIINSADKVVSICVEGTYTNCMTSGSVNIVFHRPSPDADICVVDSGNCQSGSVSNVKIKVVSAKNLERVITVWNTGQISVN